MFAITINVVIDNVYPTHREWDKELSNITKKSNVGKTSSLKSPIISPSLTRALIRAFGIRYFLLGLVPLIIECVVRYI